MWNLNLKILEEIKKDHQNDSGNEIKKITNKYLKNVKTNLEGFSYNKIIANLHEIYSFLIKEIEKGYTAKTLVDNYKKILTTMSPIIPHFANECLEILNINQTEWPEHDETIFNDEIINIVIQIKGKKRGLIKCKPNITEEELLEKINKDENLMKYLLNQEIKRKIYIKDKLLNIIT